MIRPTLDRIATWRRRERLYIALRESHRFLGNGALAIEAGQNLESARLRRRALVIEALELRRLRR